MAKGKGFTTGHDEGVGKGSHANMPQEVMMREYPKSRNYPGGNLDDTMSDIDSIASMTESKASRHMSRQK